MGALPFPPEQERALRASVRQQLAAAIPPEHVDMVLDLAINAAQKSLETLERNCDLAGDPQAYIAAIGPALGIVKARCEQLELAVRSYASKVGMRCTQGAVTFGAPSQ